MLVGRCDKPSILMLAMIRAAGCWSFESMGVGLLNSAVDGSDLSGCAFGISLFLCGSYWYPCWLYFIDYGFG